MKKESVFVAVAHAIIDSLGKVFPWNIFWFIYKRDFAVIQDFHGQLCVLVYVCYGVWEYGHNFKYRINNLL